MEFKEKLKALLESNLTSYSIANDLKKQGFTTSTQFIDDYRHGRKTIESMTLGKAEMLVNYYDNKRKEELEMSQNDKEMLEEYLENYKHSMSNQMDEKFSMFKSDVSALAVAYRKGEAFLYTKEEYIAFLQEHIDEQVEHLKSQGFDQEDIDDDIEDNVSVLNEVKESNSTVYIEKTGADGYYNY